MNVAFDPGKNAVNLAKHGLSLSEAAEFEFATAVVTLDDRFDYGEVRYRAYCHVEGQGRCLVFTVIDTSTIRVISYRRARLKEMKRHGL